MNHPQFESIAAEHPETEPLVSVIIPVYNTSLYLDEAISSIAGQTLQNIEIICINDGSTDDSPDILEKWAGNDSRISVYNQTNQGLSATRNHGLRVARGKYVYFFDSDDGLATDALFKLYEECENNDLQIIYFGAVPFSDQPLSPDEKNKYIRNGSYEGVLSGIDLFTLMRDRNDFYAPVWIQFYRRSFLIQNNLSFIEGILYEDNSFSTECILAANRVKCIPDAFYRRRIRDHSITTGRTTLHNSYSYYINYLRIQSLHEKNQGVLSDDQRKALLSFAEWILSRSQNQYAKLLQTADPSEIDISIVPEEHRQLFGLLVQIPVEKTESLKKERNELAKKYRAITERYSILSEKRKEMLMEFEKAKSHLQNVNYKLRAEKENLINENKKWKKESNSLHEHITNLKKNNDQLLRQHTELNKKYNQLLLECTDLDQKRNQLLEDNQRLQYELLATRTSFSTRLGLAITRIPRQILVMAGLRKKNGTPQKKGYHILLVLHELTYTGTPAAVLRMAKCLIKLRNHVDVWSFRDGAYRKEFESSGIDVQIIPFPDCSVAEMILSLQSYSLVIANTVFCASFADISKRYVSTVLYLREAMNLPQLLRDCSVNRSVLCDSDHILCVSDYARVFIEQEYHPVRMEVLPDYVEDEYLSGENVPNSSNGITRFIVSGTLEPRKGQRLAIQAFQSLPQNLLNRSELHILGRKPEWSRSYWSDLLPDHEKIHYHDEITDRNELLRFYQTMDVFLIPSSDDSLSLVALEAAMLSKAVVVSDHVGAKYLLSEDDIFPSGNTHALAAIMEDYVKNSDRLARSGKKNRQSYLQNATADCYTKNLSQWLKRIKNGTAGSDHPFRSNLTTGMKQQVSSTEKSTPQEKCDALSSSSSGPEEGNLINPQEPRPSVSVVIPVFNAAHYITSCINMLKKQSLQDYEVLFINDGSTDHSLPMLEKQASEDSRYHVYSLNWKGGAGAARNRGIDEAKGKYIIFLDADDEYDPHLLEKASVALEKTNADIVTYDFWRIYSDGRDKERVGVYCSGKPKSCGVFNYTDYPDRIMSSVNPTPWNKMYSLDFIRNKDLRFEEIPSTNDITFAAVSVASASKIAYIRDVLYGYRIGHSGTISETKKKDCNSLVCAVTSAQRQIQSLSYYQVIRKSLAKFMIDNLLYGFDHYIEDWSTPSARQYYESMRAVFLSDQYEEEDLSSVTDRNRQLYYAIKERPYEEYLRLSGHRLIVSLTSYPQRIAAVPIVVEALLHQTHPADEIILWLSKEEFPEKEKNLPKELLELQNHQPFHVEWIAENLKSHKKYFYAFRKYSDSMIITVDDDLYFPEDLIDHLFISYLRFPSAVSARRVHLIAYETTGKIYPYELWPRETDVCIHEPRHQLLATGGAGALYPPGLLDLTLLDESLIREYSLDADDLWLKVMEISNHIPVVLTDTNHPLRYIKDTQSTALAKKNVDLNQNDTYIHQIQNWYDSIHGTGAFTSALSDHDRNGDGIGVVLYHYRKLQTRKPVRPATNTDEV